MKKTGFRFPTMRERFSIVGSTGSGKTQFATHVLSFANWDKNPWIIFDYKGDDLLGRIPRLKEISITEKIPKKAGLYVVRPLPRQEEEIENHLWQIWERGKTGVYIDEGYVIPDQGGLQALLTQGRSKQIPTIMLTQRPVFVSRFTFSEADLFSVFRLNDARDRKTVQSFLPRQLIELPAFHSHFYDVKKNYFSILQPAPGADDILNRFDMRQPKTRRYL